MSRNVDVWKRFAQFLLDEIWSVRLHELLEAATLTQISSAKDADIHADDSYHIGHLRNAAQFEINDLLDTGCGDLADKGWLRVHDLVNECGSDPVRSLMCGHELLGDVGKHPAGTPPGARREVVPELPANKLSSATTDLDLPRAIGSSCGDTATVSTRLSGKRPGQDRLIPRFPLAYPRSNRTV